MAQQWGLIFLNLNNIFLDNYWRKFETYKALGWDDHSIKQYLSQKKLLMQIASFNTPKVSFSASSRRNRYYDIFNRPAMLDMDVAKGDAISSLKKLNSAYKIFIISERSEDVKEKTLSAMEHLGFPMDLLTIYFKKPNEQLHIYRRDKIKEIQSELQTGVGVCLQPSDAQAFERFNYVPIGFSSVKDLEEFSGKIDVTCQNWAQILTSLNCA